MQRFATYILDTGANISMMSESEAKRLGLAVHETTTKMSDVHGTPSAIRLGEAPDLRIGRIHLKNVAFAISPEGNVPFVHLPNAHKGILGIPVLLALASLGTESATDNRIVVGLGNRQPASNPFHLPLIIRLRLCRSCFMKNRSPSDLTLELT
jgi:hypothetical protein